MVGSQLKYHETEKLFYEIKEPDFIRRSEFFAQGFLTIGPTLRSRLDIQLGWGHLTDRYHSDLGDVTTLAGRDKGVFNLWQAALKWEHNTLDDTALPSAGSRIHAIAMGVTGKYRYTSDNPLKPGAGCNVNWVQLDMGAHHYWQLGRRLAIGTGARALLSTRKLLPTYEASIVAAEALHPTPASYNLFTRALRANSFATVSVEPVWKLSDSFQVRGAFDGPGIFRRTAASFQAPARKCECLWQLHHRRCRLELRHLHRHLHPRPPLPRQLTSHPPDPNAGLT